MIHRKSNILATVLGIILLIWFANTEFGRQFCAFVVWAIPYIADCATCVIICFVGGAIIYTAVVGAFKLLDRWLSQKHGLCLLDWIRGE